MYVKGFRFDSLLSSPVGLYILPGKYSELSEIFTSCFGVENG